jgi:aminomethyltransferase
VRVDLKGEGARAFLRTLLANDVAKLKPPARRLYSCMLHEGGGVVDDLIVYYFTPSPFRIVVNAGTADKDIAWMRRRSATGLPRTCRSPRRELAMIAVQGPNAAPGSGRCPAAKA